MVLHCIVWDGIGWRAALLGYTATIGEEFLLALGSGLRSARCETCNESGFLRRYCFFVLISSR